MKTKSPCFLAYKDDGLAKLSLDFLERMGCRTFSVEENEFLPFTFNKQNGVIVVRTIPKKLIASRGRSTRRAEHAGQMRFRGSFFRLLSREGLFFENLVPVWHQGQVNLLVGIKFDAFERINENPGRFKQALRQISLLRFDGRAPRTYPRTTDKS